MTTLHIINHPSALDDCLLTFSQGDAVLLIGDGAYLQNNNQCPSPAYSLEADALARGLTEHGNFTFVNEDTFVDLVAEYHKSISWCQ